MNAVDWRATLAHIHPKVILALAAWNVIVALAFPLRWYIAVRLLGHRVGYLALARYRFSAFAVSYLTPGAQFGGEPLQVAALVNRHGLSRDEALASVALDKLFDLVANFTFLAIGLGLIFQQGLLPHLSVGGAPVWLVGLLSLPLLYLALLVAGVRPLGAAAHTVVRRLAHGRITARLSGRLSAWSAAIAQAEDRLGCLIRLEPLSAVWLGLPGLLMVLLSLSEYWLALYALGFHLTLAQTVIAFTATRLAFLTPLPAGMGALEAGQILALGALGFGPGAALAVSAWIRLRDAAITAAGIAFGADFLRPLPVSLAPKDG